MVIRITWIVNSVTWVLTVKKLFATMLEMDYLTIRQAAEVLQVSYRQVLLYIKNEKLPTVRLGERVVRIPKDLLDQWVKNRKEIVKGGEYR